MDSYEANSTVEEMLMKKAGKMNIPISGVLELLPLCNMNCDMCYVRLSKKEMEARGQLKTVSEWLAIAEELKEAGTLFLLLTGGEPLIYPEFRELYVKLQEMGFIVSLNTNGTLIDEAWADFFVEHKPKRINITLYGPDEDAYEKLCHYKDGYQKVVKAIHLLLERGIKVRINRSLAKNNCYGAREVNTYWKPYGVSIHTDTYMMPAERERALPFNLQSRLDPVEAAICGVESMKLEMGEELYRNFLEKTLWEVEHILPEEGYGKVSCKAGNCAFTINWQGKLRPCVILTQPEYQIEDGKFLEAWEALSMKLKTMKLSKTCNGCKLRPICRMCLAAAILETGSESGTPDYLCQYSEEWYRLFKEDMKRLQHDKNL